VRFQTRIVKKTAKTGLFRVFSLYIGFRLLVSLITICGMQRARPADFVFDV
jgi:hypothetical protein